MFGGLLEGYYHTVVGGLLEGCYHTVFGGLLEGFTTLCLEGY